MTLQIINGDSLEVLATLPENSIDAVVTDPPYGLSNTDPAHVAETIGRWLAGERDYLPSGKGFMGKEWDGFVPPPALWDECLRVLKPGGHVLAFAGSRTMDLMSLGLRLAGFDIRDSVAWLYGSGFPKSMDISKAIDKANGRKFEDRFALGRHIRERREAAGLTRADVNALLGATTKCEHYESTSPDFARVPTVADFRVMRDRLGLSNEHLPLVERVEAEREIIGTRKDVATRIYDMGQGPKLPDEINVTAPATDAARQWEGWGTALKPAFEPVIMARKPFKGTVAANVLEHGTGALNIDGCRIKSGADYHELNVTQGWDHFSVGGEAKTRGTTFTPSSGRFPANVILDEHTAALLDEQSADVSRFFYCAKAPKSERPFYWAKPCNCETVKPCQSQPGDTTESESADDRSWSTSTSGSSTTDAASHQGTTSTTGTITSSITTSQTSSSSPSLSTNESTVDASYGRASGGSLAASAGSLNRSPNITGTSALKGGPSTDGAGPAISEEWSETSVCGNCGKKAEKVMHATVKPLSLMRYLIRMVTPPGGVVLEPFAGSGTTVEAALEEGVGIIAVERDETYLPLIQARIDRYMTSQMEDLI